MDNCKMCPNTQRRPVDSMTLAMGYVPIQEFKTTFEPCKALSVGTIFPELCKPFVGKRGRVC